jgi:esterase/lipase
MPSHLPYPKTKFSVVYIHGWSSCRQDIAPIPELVAEKLGAHLFCARLSGHAHLRKEVEKGVSLVHHATAQNLMDDAVEAIEIGRKLGEKVILMGFSTGAVLCTWIASQPVYQPHIASLILVAPAFALADPQYRILKWINAILRPLPFGTGLFTREKLVKAVLGQEMGPKIQEHEVEAKKYWTCAYPSTAILNLVDVLWLAENIDFSEIDIPVMIIGNPKDNQVSYPEMKVKYAEFGSKVKQFKTIKRSPDLHVCVGRIFSAMNVESCLLDILSFLRRCDIKGEK